MDFRRGALVQIIAVHAHVKRADGHRLFPDFGQNVPQPPRERHTARGNADEDDVRADFVALGNFVSDARERALNRDGVEDDGGFRHWEKTSSFSSSSSQG
jgi:hypothetical protein